MSAAARFALEVALAWLMPWRAVRQRRQADAAFVWVVDRLVAQRQAAREQAAGPAPGRPELRLVRGAR